VQAQGTHVTVPYIIIDCAKKGVNLTTEDGKELEYVAEPLVATMEATNRIKLNQLETS
jgi:hypothetical protein